MTPPRTRRIILHVGSPKCGSTYLQQALLQSRRALRAAGIHYPHDGTGHPGNAADLMEIDRPRLEAMFPEGVHTVVLSHEDLFAGANKRGAALAALVEEDGTEVELVAFLRPFSEFIFGDYSQFMKQHFERFLESRQPYDGRSLAEFAERRVKTLNPAAFLANWQKRLGGAPLTLGGHREIPGAMIRLLGPEAPVNWKVDAMLTNPSLRMCDCDRIAAAMRDPDVPEKKIRAMLQEAFRQIGTPDPGKSPERIAWLEKVFAPKNAALLERFGFDNRLPAAQTTPVAD